MPAIHDMPESKRVQIHPADLSHCTHCHWAHENLMPAKNHQPQYNHKKHYHLAFLYLMRAWYILMPQHVWLNHQYAISYMVRNHQYYPHNHHTRMSSYRLGTDTAPNHHPANNIRCQRANTENTVRNTPFLFFAHKTLHHMISYLWNRHSKDIRPLRRKQRCHHHHTGTGTDYLPHHAK